MLLNQPRFFENNFKVFLIFQPDSQLGFHVSNVCRRLLVMAESVREIF